MSVKGPFLIDTDVLIDYLRDYSPAVEFLELLTPPIFICSISVAELYAGVREGNERLALDLLLQTYEIISVDANIAKTGGLFKREFSKRIGTSINDALIAAAAITKGATLVSLNKKHFSWFDKLHVPYMKQH